MLLGRLLLFGVSAYFQDMFLTLVRVIWVIPALCWVGTCSILLSPTTVGSSKNSHASLTWIIYPWTPKPWKMKVLHPQNMGYNPKKLRLSVPMVYYMHIIPGIKFTFVLMGKCRPEMLQQLPFKTWFLEKSHLFKWHHQLRVKSPVGTLALQQKIKKKMWRTISAIYLFNKTPCVKILQVNKTWQCLLGRDPCRFNL